MTVMQFDRRTFLAACAVGAVSCRGKAQAPGALRPEDFGARGDGSSNDTRAFAALSAEVNRRGGGTITFGARKTYIVGEQMPGGDYGWTPAPILRLHSLTRPLRIIGNGARMRCQPGLRYGTFDPATGAPIRRPMPNLQIHEVASPYRSMIWIHDCRAAIELSDLELDGNLEQLRLGGPYGDTGWQIPASGLWLLNNRNTETVTNLFTHHHGQDGLMIDGDDKRAARSRFSRLVSRHNGRQGASIVGGRSYDFADCEFSHTGRSAISSAPGGGVDIEAEGGKTNRDFSFTRCKFIDNSGVGMVADTGDSEGTVFNECLFVGTTNWSAWPRKARFVFNGCTFVGALVNIFADRDPGRATRFLGCRFTDDPALSPTGLVYAGGEEGAPMVNMGTSDNILFSRCRFEMKAKGVLPWSWRAVYADCTMSQVSPVPAMTKGRYRGHNVINGPVDLYGSMIEGTVILNGKQVPRGKVGHDVVPW